MHAMTLLRLLVLATATVVVALSVAGTGTAAGASTRVPSCDAHAGRTLQANSQVRVYRRTVKRGYRTYACFRASRRVTSLGDYAEFAASTIVEDVRLSGRFVATWTSSYGKGGTPSVLIHVRDARTGQERFYAPLSTQARPVGNTRVSSMLLTDTGHIAWIAGGSIAPLTYEVHAGAAGQDRLLASGVDIDPASLAVTASVAYWTQGGRPMSASF
jgi:hypothetical protein